MTIGSLTANHPLDPLVRIRTEVGILARQSNPGRASWRPLKEAILKGAGELRRLSGQDVPPVDLCDIASSRRILRTTYSRARLTPEAVLVPIGEGFVVRLAGGQPRVRNRTSLAHEIGHTFFFDLEKNPPTRLLVDAGGLASHKEEDICKAFARELLLPTELVRGFLKLQHNTPLDLLSSLAARFAVSIELVAVRLLWDLHELKNTIAVFAEMGESPESRSGAAIRKYLGENVKQPRKVEQELLGLITEVLVSGPPFDRLLDIELNCSDFAQVEWKLEKGNQPRRALAVLSFKRGDTWPKNPYLGSQSTLRLI